MNEEQQKIVDWEIYFPDRFNPWEHAIRLENCRLKVQNNYRFYQCSRNWVEKIGGFGFCKQHAKKIKERLGI